jgi:putative Ca2+/H+ antiporter (TMEM165/GDT1 family)
VLSPTVVVTAFLLVMPVELPDKTLFATLVLSTRFRPLPVFAGACVAFAAQCVIAVAFGSVLALLPDRALALVVALLFGIGAVILLREGFGELESADELSPQEANTTNWRAALITFGVLFAAEFGDASQLATAALTARTAAPLAVGLGAWLALVTVAGVGVLVGKRLGTRLPRRALLRIAGLVFAVIAAIAAIEAI